MTGPDPLLRKLGFRHGTAAILWQVPDELASRFPVENAGGEPTFLLAFVWNSGDLATVAGELVPNYRRGGHLWIAYPKKSGRIASDLTRDHGWEPIAALGLLAVTQIAVDEDWSALRFRYRDEVRKLTRRSEQPRDS